MKALERTAGVGYTTLHNLKRGGVVGPRIAERIVEYTNGEVTFEDLCRPTKPVGSE